jgi:hypothetical protein
MSRIKLDLESDVVREQFAVVYAPTRTTPGREEVEPYREQRPGDAHQAALAAADPSNKRFAAAVLGPSRSSERFMLYYLVQRLGESQ